LTPSKATARATRLPSRKRSGGGVERPAGPFADLAGGISRRRAFAWKKLNSIPGISCVNAKGAFYLFPNISKTGWVRWISARNCSKRKKSPPCRAAFGADDYIRISYATSMENIEKGLDRIEKFVRGRA
jgi:aspartate aminotransferase